MRFRVPTPILVVAIVLVTAGLLALGAWQLQRHEWKQALVAERDTRIAAAPVDVTALVDQPRDAADWRRVSASGSWDHAHTMVVTNRVRFGLRGEEVVTPLRLDGGGPALLVDRGWYPLSERERVLATLAAESRGTVDGLARVAGDGGGHVIPSGAWNRLDALAMGATLPYPALSWLVIEGQRVPEYAAGAGDLPLQQYVGFRNTTPHMQYALTWFLLAGALIVIASVRFVVAPRRAARRAAGAPDAPDA